ncbi:MAG: HNH endonuclease [Lachnospiraceae bacterium]|nr:HNH endonuclease [Lachnospiraceae bacterium]
MARIDRTGEFRTQFEKNRLIVLRTQEICGICGQPVDKSLKTPHPLSATVDHIIPVSKGGHPSDLANLQIAHRWCNRWKSDKLLVESQKQLKTDEIVVNNDDLPLHFDWTQYGKR